MARAVARRVPRLDRALFTWQVGRFVRDASARATLVPALYRDFVAARPAFWRLTADLPSTLRDRRRRVPDLARLPVPVRVVFGARDPYLGPRVARELAGWFGVEPVLVPDAGHYVQVDAPAAVAHQISGHRPADPDRVATYAGAVAGTYQQFCAVAAALDAVGDRWTLLVVRELLAGPRRYGELVQGLPGVATNLLAERLRRLEAAGLVAQDPGPDGRARVYRLTDRGAELDAVVAALARFGIALLPTTRPGWPSAPTGSLIAVRLLLRPGALDADLVVRFDVVGSDGPEVLQLRLGPAGAADDPDGTADVARPATPRRRRQHCATPPALSSWPRRGGRR